MLAASTYSLIMKKEKAHGDQIFNCLWIRANISEDPAAAPKDIVITSGISADIKVWEWQDNTLEFKRILNEHSLSIISVAISPDGQTLVSTGMDFLLVIWDMVSGHVVHNIPMPSVWRAAFAPDGLRVVTGCHTGDLIVYDVVRGEVDCILDTRESFAIDIVWSPNEKYIACGTTSGAVCVLDPASCKIIRTFKDHRDTVKSISFSPNSRLLVTASLDCTFKLYDIVAGTLLHSLLHTCRALSVCFSPDGRRVALGTGEGEVMIALIDGLQVVKTFKEHVTDVWQVRFNPGGNLLMSTSGDKSINVYECPPLVTNK